MKKTTLLLYAITMIVSWSLTAQVAINKDASQPNSNSILHVKGDDTHKNVILETGTNGRVGIGTINPTHTLHIYNAVTDSTLRLEGHIGLFHHGAKINFGDGDNVYIQEDEDDKLYIKARLRVTLESYGTAINDDGSEPDPSAILDVKSNYKGFLLPRLSVAEIASISNPADGLQVYNTTDGELYIYVALLGSWKQLDYGMHSLSSDCGYPITDVRDGKTYNTVKIGSQCWMAENLNIGIRIDGSVNQAQNTPNEIIEKYCYNDIEDSCDIYGGLYQWDEMMQYVTTEGTQGICPTGWHLPTDAEWKTMEMYLGMSQTDADAVGLRGTDEGGKLKKPGTTHWYSPNLGATNESGFAALPGGYRYSDGTYGNLGYNGYWWSSSESTGTYAWYRHLDFDNGQVGRGDPPKTYGLSVRCLKN